MRKEALLEAKEGVIESVERLDTWIRTNGWAGYDPYDIKGHPLILRMMSNAHLRWPLSLVRQSVLNYTEYFPQASRRFLRIEPEINAKAMGLFASAYLALHRILGEESYLIQAQECLLWLEKNNSPGYLESCWGYPFDWQSLVLLPKGTPSAVVTSICAHAFWDFYEYTGDQTYLDVCQSACRFFTRNLKVDCIDNDHLCFSYTPLDRFHVHNANLFVAEFLIRVGIEVGNSEWQQYGTSALNYTLDAQNADGSFYYWALSEKDNYSISNVTLRNIDHYHTGFVLRSLYSIYKGTQDSKVFKALTSGYKFYRDFLFEDMTVPKLKSDRLYPINIHSCAEAILCMSTMSDLFPDAAEYAVNSACWSISNMQDSDGYFYYLRNIDRAVKIPYIRWGQAWMMRALAAILQTNGDDAIS